MGLERVEGVVIRTRDLGEADRIVSLYTRERGKVRAVARGARRPRNRFASLAQVPIHGRFGVFQGRGLGTLSQESSSRRSRPSALTWSGLPTRCCSRNSTTI